ncbi:Maf family protein [Methylocella tundrae]|uniref:Nucleoside triphosphate pyrophosphatase n=1 Tax=Methylocella tundrae TaxID=227605 RepID=A0A4U8Z3E4_METTU|nr:Maf family protein [Methylocella tundrae]WPP03759.1 Maf family protein [Methylocella tundrae]VFU09917.1 Maf-like protein Nham_0113 [Methylocella tundrae]
MSALWRGPAPLLLASRSAARRTLLTATGIPFESCDASIDERAVEAPLRQAGAGGATIALHLARKKALSAGARARGQMVIGADQTLSCEGRLFTKPQDRAAASVQLEALAGKTHELHSAICVVMEDRILFEAVPVARLTMRPLSPAFIAAYLDEARDAVLGSVGAYQLEGLGVHLFERIEGDHFVILGLPLLPLLDFLRAEGSLQA